MACHLATGATWSLWQQRAVAHITANSVHLWDGEHTSMAVAGIASTIEPVAHRHRRTKFDPDTNLKRNTY